MSSPQTPRHSRQSSAIDTSPSSPQFRRQSNEPSSPYRPGFNREDTLDLSVLSSSGGASGGNGMGNLADELADAFSESGDEDVEDDTGNVSGDEDAAGQHGNNEGDSRPSTDNHRGRDGSLNIPSPRKKNHRRNESAYDGSEYGSESDLDSSGMPPSLVAKIDAIESLARRGNENYGGPTDDVVKRVTDALRDLGSQSSVEGSASR